MISTLSTSPFLLDHRDKTSIGSIFLLISELEMENKTVFTSLVKNTFHRLQLKTRDFDA
jgi:hypothetical protein